MATRATQGSASALPTLPPIRKGRVRLAEGVHTGGGELSLRCLERDGEAIPANVVRLSEPKPTPPEPVTRSPALLLALAVFGAMTDKQRQKVKAIIRAEAFDRDPSARSLAALFGEA